MAKSAKQLREERAALIKQAQAFNEEKADAETGLLTAEDQASFDTMIGDSEAMLSQAKRLEALDNAASTLNAPTRPGLTPEPGATPHGEGSSEGEHIYVRAGGIDRDGKPKYLKVPVNQRGAADYQAAFNKYLAARSLTPEQFSALRSDDADQVGFMVASEQFASELLKDVDDLTFVRRYAKIHTVPKAESLGITKRVSKAATFAWSSELAVSAEDAALAYGKKVLTPHALTGQIKVSRDLVRRSTMSVDSTIREEFSRDAGEVMEDAYLFGHGNQQPLGVFTASADGISTSRDVATGSETSITADGLQDAKYALKSQYRKGLKGEVRWLFHRDAVKIIAKLKDGDNHYMFRPGQGINGTDPDSLLGYALDESERAPNTFTAGNYCGLLANWRYYEIADALDMEIQVLDQLYAQTNQYGYIGRMKTDGMPTIEEAFVRLKCATS